MLQESKEELKELGQITGDADAVMYVEGYDKMKSMVIPTVQKICEKITNA